MSILRPSEITPDRVRRFAAAIGGYGVVAGTALGRLMSGAWRTDRELYATTAVVVLSLAFGLYELRRWPPSRFL